ncbi:MAG: LuxR C-terminal-related transcriptional regulator [Sulfitobacter sp.]
MTEINKLLNLPVSGFNQLPQNAISQNEAAPIPAPQPTQNAERMVLLLSKRALDRDCLERSIHANDATIDIKTAGSFAEWIAQETGTEPALTILVVGADAFASNAFNEMIDMIHTAKPNWPLLVIADSDDLAHMINAMEHGACGFVPSSQSEEIACKAIGLALAGGQFLPAEAIMASSAAIKAALLDEEKSGRLLTPREDDVARELRRGKPNKIIAYELDLCESTVKVHIRNIMRKLKVSNRTEAAFRLNELF